MEWSDGEDSNFRNRTFLKRWTWSAMKSKEPQKVLRKRLHLRHRNTHIQMHSHTTNICASLTSPPLHPLTQRRMEAIQG